MISHIAGAAGPPENAYDADVVILALDRADETIAAIQSALMQTGVTRHVFCVDQGSHPDNLARVADAVFGCENATLVSLGGNFGVAGGRNRGASLGHGRIIAVIDNDAEFAAPDTLAGLVAALDRVPDLAAVGCRIVVHGSDADDLSSWGYPVSLLPRAGGSFDAATFVGAGHAIRRAAWRQVGGYDEALFFCWEEFDFCLRAIQHGWRIRYRGDLLVRHKVSPEHRFAWSAQRWFYFVRNRLYIARKYDAPWPAVAARMAGYTIKGVRHGVFWATLRAVAAAVRMASTCRRHSLSATARMYLRRTDRLHRGGWLTRLQREVLARLPG